MREVDVPIKISEGAELPTYGSSEAAGADLRAHLDQELIIQPGKSQLIPTGISLEIPNGYEIQVRPRSGLALKEGVTVLNTPGTIDSDYRGEVGVILINHGAHPFRVTPNMRIAQLVLAPVFRIRFRQKDQLNETIRGLKGFGHTGTH